MPAIDFVILDWIQEHLRCGFLDAVMPAITNLAWNGLIWIILASVLLLVRKYRKCGMTMLVGLAAGSLVSNLLIKNLVGRPRPVWINQNIEILVTIPQDFSFPSGHSTASFAAAAVLLHYDKRFGIPALVLAVLIAFSRLYLYVHFPSDVAAGTLIGIVIGMLAVRFMEGFLFPRLSKRINNAK